MLLPASLATLAALLLSAAPATGVDATTRALADGSRVAAVRLPGARTCSLRYLVGAGATNDPPGKAGLAHYLEHLVMHGSYGSKPWELDDAARAAGANLNAWTLARTTVYVLDAPCPVFAPLVRQLLRTATNPALGVSRRMSELGVVEAEVALRPSVFGVRSQLEELLFASSGAMTSLGGSVATRQTILDTDLAAFFAQHYTARNTLALFVGDLDLDAAATLVEEASCLPPEKAGSPAVPGVGNPRLPLRIEAQGPVTFAIYGYSLEGVEARACAAAAGVLERRLVLEVVGRDPMVSALSVGCSRFRGVPALLAVAYTSGTEASGLADALEVSFAALAQTAPGAEELRGVTRRRQAMELHLRQSPAELADRLSLELSDGDPDLATAVEWVAPSADVKAADVKKIAARFQEDNRIFVHFTPFRGP